MTRTATGLGLAAALGFAVSLGAQSTTTTSADQRAGMHNDKGREITVTGCLARGSNGTYMLNDARMDDTKSTTTTTAGTTTGTTGSSSVGTTAAEPSGHNAPMSWKLEGGTDLDRHVGHKIQVTGRSDWNEHSGTSSSASSTTTTTGTTGSTSSTMSTGPRLDVSSVKMISSSCQ